jgi:hypothetical protein
MRKAERRDLEKERYWRRMLRQWRGSGMSGRDFCSEHGLSEPSFYSWRREIVRRDQEETAAVPGVMGIGAPARPTSFRSPIGSSTAPRSTRKAGNTFVKVALPHGAMMSSTIDIILAETRVLRVGRGFDAELLREVVRVLEESSC